MILETVSTSANVRALVIHMDIYGHILFCRWKIDYFHLHICFHPSKLILRY